MASSFLYVDPTDEVSKKLIHFILEDGDYSYDMFTLNDREVFRVHDHYTFILELKKDLRRLKKNQYKLYI